jgi:hypothetical protein
MQPISRFRSSNEAMFPVSLAFVLVLTLPVTEFAFSAEPPPRTSLSDPSIRFSVPEKPYTVLRRGSIEAVVVDNRAVNDDVLPNHRAGYHGIGSLKHDKEPRNLFVPNWAGLNFEHIHDGTAQDRKILFEPREAPIQWRAIDATTAELYQAPTPHWGLESCLRYRLLGDEMIELVFECTPIRDTYKNGYIGLFWASYINNPESRDIHFLVRDGVAGKEKWVQSSSPRHGISATHPGMNDRRDFRHDNTFPLSLVFNFSDHRYAQPWYLGICRNMAYVQIFRTEDNVRFSQSPSGGGENNPAWDFQWFIPDYKIGRRYQLVMRVLYTVHDVNFASAFDSEERLARAIKQARRFD